MFGPTDGRLARPAMLKIHAFKLLISLATIGTLLSFFSATFSPSKAWSQSNSPSPTPNPTPSATPARTAPKPPTTPQSSPTANPTATPSATPAYTPEPSKKFPKTVTKLMIEDLQNGRGRSAKPQARLVVHFTSWLYDPTQPLGRGPQFESTQGKAPYSFQLQNPEAPHIKGWEQGLVDMKVGGKRRLIIPPDLGYGDNGAGQTIPPGATLLYEIELLDIE